MKVTLVRKAKEHETQRTLNLVTVMDSLRRETKEMPVSTMRSLLQHTNEESDNIYTEKLPKILFSVELGKEEDGKPMKTYNGLILLTVDGFVNTKEAGQLRDKVSKLPQTMAAFVGSDGRNVKILVPFSKPDGTLPATVEDARLFHAHAYQWAFNFYQGQLLQERRKVTLQPSAPEQSCLFTYDPELYFNPETYPIHLEQPTEMPAEATYREEIREEPDPLKRMMPGYERSEIISTLFETSLSAALGQTEGRNDGEAKALLTNLARNCFQSGIPEEEVVGWTIMHFGRKFAEIHVRQTIGNVYSIEKYFGENPCMPQKQNLALRTDEFMKRRYEFRYNTQMTVVEYRERKTFFFDFRPVTERVLNTIAVNAISEGLDLWDRDVKRWVNSARVPLFSPIDDYLAALPEWDGKDRIRSLAASVPCDNLHWKELFHRWFLSMVAHWKGYNKKYANSVSPLLIGAQGCGKSTFCRNILPPQLQAYYTDSIDFSLKRDAELSLNRFALINIDEFDQVSANHQGFLKHILQKPVVNTRKPHQTAIQELRRYASFIATSNHSDLLTDTSGSRRFICIRITDKINKDIPLNHEQLYAQAMQELQSGERYYFSTEEEAILTDSNKEFELQNPAEQLFQQYFRPAEAGEPCQKLLAVEILDRLQKKSGMKMTATKIVHFGRILKKLNVSSKKANNGSYYLVVER